MTKDEDKQYCDGLGFIAFHITQTENWGPQSGTANRHRQKSPRKLWGWDNNGLRPGSPFANIYPSSSSIGNQSPHISLKGSNFIPVGRNRRYSHYSSVYGSGCIYSLSYQQTSNPSLVEEGCAPISLPVPGTGRSAGSGVSGKKKKWFIEQLHWGKEYDIQKACWPEDGEDKCLKMIMFSGPGCQILLWIKRVETETK